MTTLQFEDVNAHLAKGEPVGIKRDRYGRYLIPHPDTGKEQAWTRATTVAETLADRFGLEQWAQRNVVLGIGLRVDLYAQAAAATPDDKQTLNKIAKQAQEAASAQAKANLGSALHQFTERIDRGEFSIEQVPDPWRADIEAYLATMSGAGIAPVEGWLERVVLCPDANGEDIAGTIDRLNDCLEWRLPRISDLKTGKDVLKYGMFQIAQQLAIYAHASHWYDTRTGCLHPMPEVDQDIATVMHLPVGSGRCELIEVDIAAGWEAVQLAVEVRRWRKRKNLGVVIETAEPNGSHGVPVPAGVESPESLDPPSKAPGSPVPPGDDVSGIDIALFGKDDSPIAEGYKAAVWWEYPDPDRPPVFGLTYNGRPTHMCYGLDYFDPVKVIAEVKDRFYFDAGGNGRPIYTTKHELQRVFEALDLLPASPASLDQLVDSAEQLEAKASMFRARLAWLRGRVVAIVEAGHADDLAGCWSEVDHIPTFPDGGPRDDEEIDVIAGCCALVEMTHSLSFHDGDPAVQPKKPTSHPPEQTKSRTRKGKK